MAGAVTTQANDGLQNAVAGMGTGADKQAFNRWAAELTEDQSLEDAMGNFERTRRKIAGRKREARGNCETGKHHTQIKAGGEK